MDMALGMEITLLHLRYGMIEELVHIMLMAYDLDMVMVMVGAVALVQTMVLVMDHDSQREKHTLSINKNFLSTLKKRL